MRGTGVPLGSIFGIRLRADWSLLLIFVLIATNLGMGVIPSWHPDWGPVLSWTVALIAAVTFFGSILLHELSHALVAKAHKLPVRDITLFIFGGLASIERDPRTPRAEFLMAAAGPLTSVLIGFGCLLGVGLLTSPEAITDPEDPMALVQSLGPVATILAWLGPVNLLLAVFNMVPGFPLDGGRVLRAILWAAFKDLHRATRLATRVGQGFALLLIGSGVLMLLGTSLPFFGAGAFQGLWFIFIGWFLYSAASASYQQMVLRNVLEGVPVRQLMRPATRGVSPGYSLAALVEDRVLHSDERVWPVMDGETWVGVVSLMDIRKVPRAEWPTTSVVKVMAPADQIASVTPNEDAYRALSVLRSSPSQELPVVQHGRLLGVVRGTDVMRWLELTRDEDASASHREPLPA